MPPRPALLILPLLLAACDRAPAPAQRIDLEEVEAAMPRVMATSPDTTLAVWRVSETGQALHFGDEGGDPLLTLACRPTARPPEISVIRHAPALPGQGALFPVIGNGMRSRFLVDAVLADGEWRWEAKLAASDPMLDVFTGPRELLATLPGGGTLKIGASRLPGEFVTWCRNGGQIVPAGAEPAEEPVS